MRKAALLLVALSLVLIPALLAQGVDIGAKLGVQSESLTLQGEVDVSPALSVGFFAGATIAGLFDSTSVQTSSVMIGMIGKYRFIRGSAPIVPYVGLAAGYESQAGETSVVFDLLAGARWDVLPYFHLFGEIAFAIWPYDPSPWYAVLSRQRNLYLGFGVWFPI